MPECSRAEKSLNRFSYGADLSFGVQSSWWTRRVLMLNSVTNLKHWLSDYKVLFFDLFT